MQGTFLIRKADEADVIGIMKVMNEAQGDKEHPDWFVADKEDYIRAFLPRSIRNVENSQARMRAAL